MRTSIKGLAALAMHEAIVLSPYRDSVGVWTWGIGHTAGAGDPDPAKMVKGVPSDEEATMRRVIAQFQIDIARYEAQVSRAIKNSVEQHEFDAAVSFHYNTGAIGTATWVKTLNAGNKGLAANQIMNWTKPEEIIPRRQSEQRLFRDGAYPTGDIAIYTADLSGNVQWSRGRSISQSRFLDLLAFSTTASVAPQTQPTATNAALDETIAAMDAALSAIEKAKLALLKAREV